MMRVAHGLLAAAVLGLFTHAADAAPAGEPRVRLAQMPHGAAPSRPAQAQARTFRLGDLVVEEPWLRATPGGAKVAGGYMTIVNNGQAPDRLVGGSVEGAGRFEMHEMAMEGDVMRMRPLPQGLELRPGAAVELKPGGLHIMGLDLTSGYRQGETVKGTLVFEKAGTMAVEYRVAPIGGSGAPHGGH